VRAAARVLDQPQVVLDKHPTAGLWGGQTDEDELGFTYRDADLALVAMFDLAMTPEAAAERTGVALDVVRRVKARAEAVAWKHTVPHAL
jgi:NAD+ synthase